MVKKLVSLKKLHHLGIGLPVVVNVNQYVDIMKKIWKRLKNMVCMDNTFNERTMDT